MAKRTYNLKFSKTDHRDYLYELHEPEKIIKKIPSSIDLRPLLKNIPIFDQQIGDCTANSWARMRMALMLIAKVPASKIPMLSRLYIYVRERILEGTVSTDSGAEPRDGAISLLNNGVCKESLYPYDVEKFTDLPTPAQDADAVNYKIKSYYAINSIDGIKNCLAYGFPISFGCTVYQELEEIGSDGFLKMPTSTSQVLGGHEITIIGFKDTSTLTKLKNKLIGSTSSAGYFIIANSWGTNWGDQGYFYMPYEYLNVAQWEAWSIR